MIKPLADNVLIEPIEETTTSSGIIIPDTMKEKPEKGKVLAVGEFVDGIEIGDVVLFQKWMGEDVEIDRKDAVFISAEYIMAVFKGE